MLINNSLAPSKLVFEWTQIEDYRDLKNRMKKVIMIEKNSKEKWRNEWNKKVYPLFYDTWCVVHHIDININIFGTFVSTCSLICKVLSVLFDTLYRRGSFVRFVLLCAFKCIHTDGLVKATVCVCEVMRIWSDLKHFILLVFQTLSILPMNKMFPCESFSAYRNGWSAVNIGYIIIAHVIITIPVGTIKN